MGPDGSGWGQMGAFCSACVSKVRILANVKNGTHPGLKLTIQRFSHTRLSGQLSIALCRSSCIPHRKKSPA